MKIQRVDKLPKLSKLICSTAKCRVYPPLQNHRDKGCVSFIQYWD